MLKEVSRIPLISFIVTCYNFELFIGKTIESILSLQGYDNYELIIIDDASTDDSVVVIKKFNDSRITFIQHGTNKGSNFSVNEGFEKAQGKYIARLDGDDYYAPDFLIKTIPIFEKYSDVGLVYGDFVTINGNGIITNSHAKPARGNLPTYGNEFKSILKKYYIAAPTIIARKEAWKLGLPIPREFSFLDWFLSLSILSKWNSYYISSPLAYYRIHEAGMHNVMIKDRRGEEITRLILDRFIPLGLERQLISKNDVSEIEANNYLLLGDKYFGSRMFTDARRCYFHTLKRKPTALLQGSFTKHMFGSVFPSFYHSIKNSSST